MLRKLTIGLVLPLVTISFSGCKDGDSPSEPSSTPSTTTTSVPARAFGNGTHRIGEDINPGRYFADPQSGCFWERLSGFSGTLDDVIANEFIGFDSRQEIVAIGSMDVAFSADVECGDWYTTPRHGMQSNIPPAIWLVGNQIAPGTYRTTAAPGCYWERLRNFGGRIDGIIANDFVAGGGTQFVTIMGGDLGFSSDADCGTWTREQTLASENAPTVVQPEQSTDQIETNRRLNEEQDR